MKKTDLKKILTISVLIFSLSSGIFNSTVRCESEDCCKTECCEENSPSADSDINLILSNPDCCVYNQETLNNSHVALSHNTKINISAPSNLIYKTPQYKQSSYFLHESLQKPVRQSRSIPILRI